jgi:hypothetical protein
MWSVETHGPHGVISQKMILFKATAVKTSNPTETDFFYTEDKGNTFLQNAGTYLPTGLEMRLYMGRHHQLTSIPIHLMEPFSSALRHPNYNSQQ